MTTLYYRDDLVTVYHGDCREIDVVTSAIVSDPPYGMNYKHGARKGGVKYGMDERTIVGDDVPFDPAHMLAADVPTILWGGNHFADKLPASRGWLVWDKRDGRPPNDQSDAELAWTNILTTARVHGRYWSGNARGGREQAEGRLHANQKPVALMRWCLEFLPADSRRLVTDPYAGSGSTLVAAAELGIPSVGIEIDEANCEIIARRFDQGVLDFGATA